MSPNKMYKVPKGICKGSKSPLIISKIQIKTTVRYHLILLRWLLLTRYQWLMPVILATQEAENRKTMFEASLYK
jgi:hypothetical protein